MDRKLLIILIFGIIMRLLFVSFTVDDAFITFRYAQNLAEGRGFVYNPGEQVLGITNPLYGLIIAFGIILGMDPIVFSKIIGLVCYVIISLIGWNFLKSRHSNLSAYAFAILLAVDHYTSTWFMSGMETALFSLTIILSVILFLTGKETSAGILAGLSLYFRPEGGFLLLLIFLKSKKKRNILPGIMIALAFFLLCQLFYGFPLPYSIYAKTSQSSLGLAGIVKSGYHLANSIIKEPFPVFLAIFAPWGVLSILLFPAAIFLSYFILGTPVFFWYYAPYYPLIFLAAAVGLSRLSEAMKPEFRRLFVTILLVFIALHQISFAAREVYLQKEAASNRQIYKDFAVGIASNESSKLVAGDIGVLGYYSRHYIFDVAGLVSPKAVECWKEGNLPKCIAEINPDYFVVRKNSIQEDAIALTNCTTIITESRLHKFYRCD